eukprot:CAMPEP_0194200510 /NCGR_PEP_ID=MMETSP0156-20130528/1083_1 /TAXON_ID=33649 /ORGANISM="Thalassionema nitzschioides, Strain L26-B" /LENGTH=246 /DNA_ID=CAMNT_0038925515 /DNA_START=146 /DNA_END=886 /DNA_ORIENTATION=+
MARISSSSSVSSVSSSASHRKKKGMEDSDEALAKALAKEEQESADEMLARGMQAMGSTFENPSPAQGNPSYPAQRRSGRPRDSRSSGHGNMHPGFSKTAPEFEEAPSLCYVPCVIGKEMCVEMMVDTGAQTSVMSLSLAQQLGLENQIDRRYQGVAAGVGRAQIVGKIKGVICELGHVEFVMNFSVLEVQDKLLLLGLDLMRKYRCVVNLDKDTLAFGGEGGVEVDLLPPTEQHINLRNQVGCPQM